MLGCTWTVEIHTKRSSLIEIRDKQLIDVSELPNFVLRFELIYNNCE